MAGDGISAALERHAHEVSAVLAVELLHERDLRKRARHVAQRLGLCSPQRGELFEGLHVQRRVHREDLREDESLRDGSESPARIKSRNGRDKNSCDSQDIMRVRIVDFRGFSKYFHYCRGQELSWGISQMIPH
jgi:hypothetical protein